LKYAELDDSQGEVLDHLPGEPDGSREPAEVKHWQLVLGELVMAFDELLDQLPATEILSSRRLPARRHELIGRLAHWTQRQRQLELL